jgi:hypothetical protein
MGPIEKTSRAIASARLPITLVIIAGRNEDLKARLKSYQWPMPTLILAHLRA